MLVTMVVSQGWSVLADRGGQPGMVSAGDHGGQPGVVSAG